MASQTTNDVPWFLDETHFDGGKSATARPATTPDIDVLGLTRRMRAGDDSAFEEFHACYFDRMFRYAFVLCRGNEESAKEVTQDALLRVVRYVKPKPNEQVLWNWLSVLLRSAGADHGRKRSRYRKLLERFHMAFDVFRPGQPSPDADTPAMLLSAALTELSEDERLLIERKYFERQSYHALAIEYSTSERAIEGRLARIRSKLRRLILHDQHNNDSSPS